MFNRFELRRLWVEKGDIIPVENEWLIGRMAECANACMNGRPDG